MGASGRGDGSTVGTSLVGTGIAWGSSTGIQYGTTGRDAGLLGRGTESIGRVVGGVASLDPTCAASTNTTWSLRVGAAVTDLGGRCVVVVVVGRRVGDWRGGREVGVLVVGTVAIVGGCNGLDSIDLVGATLGNADGVWLGEARFASPSSSSGGMIQMASTLVDAAETDWGLVARPTWSRIKSTIRQSPTILVRRQPRVQDAVLLVGGQVAVVPTASGHETHGCLVVGAAAVLLLRLVQGSGNGRDTAPLALPERHHHHHRRH